MISEKIWNQIACPACGGKLAREGGQARCGACALCYPSANGKPDLRLRQPKIAKMDFPLGTDLPPKQQLPFGPIPVNPAAGAGLRISRENATDCYFGNRLTRELLSWFPKASRDGALMLDLGCGNKRFQKLCQPLEYNYVGVDYQNAAADLLGDAHALPFVDQTFDFAVSFAVLEHLRYPFVALQEVFRTLRPGALFIGSVAFLEPYHQSSYYHTTGLGLYSSLIAAGFEVQHIEANEEWTVLPALAGMNFFPGLPAPLGRLLLIPAQVAHRFLWALRGWVRETRGAETDRLHFSTGGFRFIARRPEA